MGSQAVTMGPLGVPLHLSTSDCTKISLSRTSDFLWFTFFTFLAHGRQPNGVLHAYTLMTTTPIFVKRVATVTPAPSIYQPDHDMTTVNKPICGFQVIVKWKTLSETEVFPGLTTD